MTTSELHLESKLDTRDSGRILGGMVLMTPDLSPDYWTFRKARWTGR